MDTDIKLTKSLFALPWDILKTAISLANEGRSGHDFHSDDGY